jgi:hypothetical protein
MYENRTLTRKRKPRLILDRRFKQFDGFDVGEHGQALLKGTIIGERKEMSDDNDEIFIKTIEVNDIEILNNQNAKNYL